MTVAAGLMAYRHGPGQQSLPSSLEILLAHPGGPYWENRDDGAWTIPKGLCEPDEDVLTAAIREFAEETGFKPPVTSTYLSLGEVKMKSSSKRVNAWAFELPDDAGFSTGSATSNTFELEWPPKSGEVREFPEIDRVEWFVAEVASRKLLEAQSPLVGRLLKLLAV